MCLLGKIVFFEILNSMCSLGSICSGLTRPPSRPARPAGRPLVAQVWRLTHNGGSKILKRGRRIRGLGAELTSFACLFSVYF